MKIKLTSDVYEISKRIKNIDKDYYMVYDTSKRKFEVHNSSQIGSTYCLTLPYDYLDARALKYVIDTKSENLGKILQKIDDDNRSLESTEKNRALGAINDAIERSINGNN
jgi:predicted GH43/DUF377 family glycosyl hydrolase